MDGLSEKWQVKIEMGLFFHSITSKLGVCISWKRINEDCKERQGDFLIDVLR